MGSDHPDQASIEHGFYGNERFELLGCLGEGAYGVVYRAYDRARDAHVALKVLRSLGPDTIFYFKREFRALVDIEHPNLVRYRELFEEQGRWFLTMDLIHGVPLLEYVRGGKRAGPLTDAQCVRLRRALSGIAAGLRMLHAAGKVHRDVKPSNLRVSDDGHVTLLDFGLVTDHDARQSVRFPAAGTAAYMAPEQVDAAYVGPEADWYAVGVMLYECLTGRAPFVGDPLQVLRTKQVQLPRPPAELVQGVPEELASLCMGLLCIRPEERTPAIASFERRIAAEDGTEPAPATPPERRGFVGREEDVRGLLQLAIDPAAPPLTVAYVHGDTGLGKTALLAEFRRRIEREHPEVLVLAGRCYEREAVPYKALDGVIDALAHHLRELDPEAARVLLPRGSEKLVRAFPVFGRVRAIERAPTIGSSAISRGARRRAFEVLKELLTRLGSRRRLVLQIDDLHWADADSLALLEALFCSGVAPPCLLLCAGRTRPGANEPVARMLERLNDAAGIGVQLRLQPLRRSDAYTLALRSLRARPDASSLASAIAKESGGHPLFVDTLVRHALEGPGQGAVSLEAALEAVLQSLHPDARKLCQVLAFASVPLTREAARSASHLSWASFERAVAVLSRVGWLRLLRADRSVLVELTHDRVRALLVSTLQEPANAEVHWEIAQALVDQDADPEAIAIHFAEAGDAERATDYATRGAESASRAFAFAHAERLYMLALAHLPESRRARRRELERKLAGVHALGGRGGQAGDLYAELSRDARGAEQIELRYLAAQAWLDAGQYEEGLPWLRDLLGDLGVTLPEGGVRRSLSRWSSGLSIALRRGNYTLREPDKVSLRERLVADALWTLTCALVTNDPLGARDVQAKHLSYALDLGEPYRLARAFTLQGWLESAQRGGSKLLASDEFAAARALAKVSDEPHAHALVQMTEGIAAFLDERYTDATPLLTEAERVLREECSGVRWERTNAQLFGALCAWNTGNWRRLQRAVDDALRDADVRDDAFAGWLWRSRLGHLPYLLRGKPDAALAELEPSSMDRELPGAPPLAELHTLLSRVEVGLYRNDVTVLEPLLERWSLFSSHLATRAVRQRAWWARGRAALCGARLLTARRSELLELAEEAAQRLARERSDAVQARVGLLRAAIQEVAGDVDAACSAYREAAELSEVVGLLGLVAVADARRGALLQSEQGEALREQAHAWLRGAGAVDPARMAAVINGF